MSAGQYEGAAKATLEQTRQQLAGPLAAGDATSAAHILKAALQQLSIAKREATAEQSQVRGQHAERMRRVTNGVYDGSADKRAAKEQATRKKERDMAAYDNAKLQLDRAADLLRQSQQVLAASSSKGACPPGLTLPLAPAKKPGLLGKLLGR